MAGRLVDQSGSFPSSMRLLNLTESFTQARPENSTSAFWIEHRSFLGVPPNWIPLPFPILTGALPSPTVG